MEWRLIDDTEGNGFAGTLLDNTEGKGFTRRMHFSAKKKINILKPSTDDVIKHILLTPGFLKQFSSAKGDKIKVYFWNKVYNE